jgi:hypothetical protein
MKIQTRRNEKKPRYEDQKANSLFGRAAMALSKSFLHLSLAGTLLISPLAAFSSNTNSHGKFAGVYMSRGHDGGRDGSFMNLSLGSDGSATVTEDPGTGTTTTLFGHWADNGNQVTVSFDAQDRSEPMMAFAPGHDGMQAVTWNHALWGKENPPPMRKGGAKVKNTYWLTQNP